MSGRRALWALLAVYGVAVFVFPRYEADLLQRLVDGRAVRESEAVPPPSAAADTACARRHERPGAWQVGALAALGMFAACLVNFALGACLSLFTRGAGLGSRWSGLLDRWGLGVMAVGFLMPAGFPVGLASLYLGLRRTNAAGFLAVAAIGSACHVMVLMTAYDRLAQWLGA